MSKIAKIKQFDIANGEGIRTSIFFSGCEFCCKGCFNEELWGFDIGEPFTRELYESQIKPTINEHITGISILGGEPLHMNNIIGTYKLIKWFKNDFPNKSIWLWTGATYDFLLRANYYKSGLKYYADTSIFSLFSMIDILVDGQYEEDKRDISLRWRGSSNQRVIDVKKSLRRGKVVLYDK